VVCLIYSGLGIWVSKSGLNCLGKWHCRYKTEGLIVWSIPKLMFLASPAIDSIDFLSHQSPPSAHVLTHASLASFDLTPTVEPGNKGSEGNRARDSVL
jgi:hypothetical protein